MIKIPNHPHCQQLTISNEGLQNILRKSTSAQYTGQNIVWTDDIRHELPIRRSKSGIGSITPTTLIDQWHKILQQYSNYPALSIKRQGKWTTLTYQQYYQECLKFSKALLAMNLPQFSTINIIGFNSTEWVIAYFGSIFAKCIPVGIYTTNGQIACQYIARHSQTRLLIAQNRQLVKKYLNLLENKQIDRIVLYDQEVGSQDYQGKIMHWRSFIKSGEKIKNIDLESRMNRVKPGNCCSLIYTSGTTGMPKGVMLSHDNFTWTCKSSLQFQKMSRKPLRVVSYLPLSHAAGQFIDIVRSLITANHIFFAQPTALQGTLIQTLQQVKPQAFFSVPRVWEKIHGKMMEVSKSNGLILSKIATWAKSIGEEGTLQQARNQETSWKFKMAKQLVYNRVKAVLGLEECQFFIFGSAPLDPSIRKYFFSINFFLRNGYGMTECTAPQNSTDPFHLNLSTTEGYLQVGVSFPGTQTKIFKQNEADEDGQICMRGRNTFMGYFKNADNTSKTIDSEGFLHSGDNGRITKEGVLFITGRMKELIITAGGQNIPPILIQNQIKNALPCVANVMAIGDNRKYLTCLISLKEDPPQSGSLDKTAKEFLQSKGCKATTVKQASTHPALRNIIIQGLNAANSKAISRAQYVQDFYLMIQDFSVQNGLLTPTLKLKRNQAAKKYQSEIESMYSKAKL